MSQAIAEQIVDAVQALPDIQQQRVLDFVRTLPILPSGIPGNKLLRFLGTMPPADVREMQAALADCDRISTDGW